MLRAFSHYNGVPKAKSPEPMNKFLPGLFAALTCAILMLNSVDAHAKRLGGGKSFGGRPSYSQPYRPTPEASPGFRSSPADSARIPSAQRNQALRENFRGRGGLMGMLGGLALGGLLGAMLFGGGFEHINLFDILVLGLAAYLMFRWFAARRSAAWSPAASGSGAAGGDGYSRDYSEDRGGNDAPRGARFDTNLLFPGGVTTGSLSTAGTALPPGFDERGFIERAKQAFVHLQRAWDEGDLEEMRSLTTPAVFDELTRQMEDHLGRGHRTRIASLKAQMLEVSAEGGSDLVSVLFAARIQEDQDSVPSEVREVWHFIRDRQSNRPTWYLDGIQQVD